MEVTTQVTITFDGDKLIRDLMQNYPEASFCVRCVSYDYERCRFVFRDPEDNKLHRVHLPRLRRALPIFIGRMSAGEFRPVSRYVMPEFTDPCNWDSIALDCLVQIAIFGDVIYG